MKSWLTLAVTFFVMPVPAGAQRAASPADATVFIRVIGSAHIEVLPAGHDTAYDLDHIELATGSGFVVSPVGYVLTNDHVVNNAGQFVLTRGYEKASVTLNVERIEACFRPDAATAMGLASPCLAASVAASDPAMDLAVLFIGGANLPYVALGDSDALTAGAPADALGYPLGRMVEVGRIAVTRDVVPDVTTTPGAVSALRADDAGGRRFLQVTNSLNPGNSGGPLVDRDGYAIGVVLMKLTGAQGIGYAIPINAAKDFLEAHGVDQAVTVRRLRLGAFQKFEGKEVGLRLPEGFADISKFRSRVESDPRASEVVLRIDRVRSPWTTRRLEQALVGSEEFEAAVMAPRDVRVGTRPSGRPSVVGEAQGTAPDSAQELRMGYAVLDLGAEKLVARYIGPTDWMAYNASAIRQSLASLEAQPFDAGIPVPVEQLEWTRPRDTRTEGAVRVPVGWVIEPGSPSQCRGLPAAAAVFSASPAQDLTTVLRAAVWPPGAVDADAAAAGCSSRRGALGGASYSVRETWLGLPYITEGAFVRGPSGQVIQVEVLATEQRRAYAEALLAVWVRQSAR